MSSTETVGHLAKATERTQAGDKKTETGKVASTGMSAGFQPRLREVGCGKQWEEIIDATTL